MRGRLRRRHCDGAQEDLSREQSSPHVEIVCPTRLGVARRVVLESESCADLCASQSRVTTRINLEEFS
jgi:hypothetical protein